MSTTFDKAMKAIKADMLKFKIVNGEIINKHPIVEYPDYYFRFDESMTSFKYLIFKQGNSFWFKSEDGTISDTTTSKAKCIKMLKEHIKSLADKELAKNPDACADSNLYMIV